MLSQAPPPRPHHLEPCHLKPHHLDTAVSPVPSQAPLSRLHHLKPCRLEPSRAGPRTRRLVRATSSPAATSTLRHLDPAVSSHLELALTRAVLPVPPRAPPPPRPCTVSTPPSRAISSQPSHVLSRLCRLEPHHLDPAASNPAVSSPTTSTPPPRTLPSRTPPSRHHRLASAVSSPLSRLHHLKPCRPEPFRAGPRTCCLAHAISPVPSQARCLEPAASSPAVSNHSISTPPSRPYHLKPRHLDSTASSPAVSTPSSRAPLP